VNLLSRNFTYSASLIVVSFSLAFFVTSIVNLRLKERLPILSLERETSAGRVVLRTSISRKGFFKPKVAVKGKGSVKAAPEISEFKLRGTIVCGECGEGIAIVELEKGKTKVFRVGDEVDGYSLVKVFPKYALLKRDGRSFKLNLYEEREKAGRVSSSGKSHTSSSPFTYRVERQKVIDEISSGRFLKFINVVPNIRNGKTEGLLVRYVNHRSFIHRLGIRPGDVILSINGVEINSPEDSFSAFEQLKNEDTVIITVLRRGKRINLKYDLE